MKQFLGSAAETVDRLFDIADVEKGFQSATSDAGVDLFDNRFEYFILYDVGILKFVDEQVIDCRIESKVEEIAVYLFMKQSEKQVGDIVECQYVGGDILFEEGGAVEIVETQVSVQEVLLFVIEVMGKAGFDVMKQFIHLRQVALFEIPVVQALFGKPRCLFERIDIDRFGEGVLCSV